MTQNNLVSVKYLKAMLDEPSLVVLYTSMADIVSGQAEPLPAELIPGSVFFDFEKVFCDTSSGLPHTMPSSELFELEARKLGINANSQIVVYDSKGLYSAPRVWWMFKAMGHNNISVLNGGLPAWLLNHYPVETALHTNQQTGDFKAKTNRNSFVSARWIVDHLDQINVIDARSSARFNGTAAEPRAGLRSGHIPGSANLPFNQCIDNGGLLPPSELKQQFADLNLNQQQPLVFSCGSGVTACILALAAIEAGYVNLSVYDGSWSEWGAKTELPVEC